MISVSHKHKAIFWHIHKTGGSYVDFILQKYYDFKFSDLNVNQINFNKINYDKELKTDDKEDNKEENKENNEEENNKNTGLFGNCVENISKRLNMDNDKWRSYFKFAFIRNPYERAISSYEFIRQKDFDKRRCSKVLDKECTFTDFYVNKNKYNTNGFMYSHAYQSQHENLKNTKSDVQIDYLAKFENINQELIDILIKIGVDDYKKHFNMIKHNLKINASVKNNYTTYYDIDALNAVNDIYNDDFEYLGFTKYDNIEDLNEYLNKCDNEALNIKKNLDLLNKYNYECEESDDDLF